MIAQKIIAHADAICPNVYTQEEKLRWLWQFDVLLQKQVRDLGLFSNEIPMYDAQSELLIENAYCGIYVNYLLSQFNFNNGDIEKYNASATMFNAAYERYLKHLFPTEERRSGDEKY